MPISAALRSTRTYLTAAALTLAAACGAGAALPAAAAAARPVLDAEERALRSQINAYRAARGRAPLRVSAPLTRSAQWLSRDMAAKDYLDHVDSRGRDFDRRIAAFGFRGPTKGENLAGGAPDAAATFAMLKGSASHRRTMLRANLRLIGIGRAYGEGSTLGWYWSTTFGAGARRAGA
ncbi:MAG: CAP domain-containing protein [Solirubrobacteraceae bacterium]|nr:CAP domain-containing protein [Solirubrobacteraceae bacterium]